MSRPGRSRTRAHFTGGAWNVRCAWCRPAVSPARRLGIPRVGLGRASPPCEACCLIDDRVLVDGSTLPLNTPPDRAVAAGPPVSRSRGARVLYGPAVAVVRAGAGAVLVAPHEGTDRFTVEGDLGRSGAHGLVGAAARGRGTCRSRFPSRPTPTSVTVQISCALVGDALTILVPSSNVNGKFALQLKPQSTLPTVRQIRVRRVCQGSTLTSLRSSDGANAW